jgi:hypothetical protein
VTVKGHEIIGDLRTDALHEALARAPIEDDALLALTLISFASQNVSVTSTSPNNYHSASTMARLIAGLIKDDGTLILERETLQQTARSLLSHVLSCQVNRTNSGFAARIVPAQYGHGRIPVLPVALSNGRHSQVGFRSGVAESEGHAVGVSEALCRHGVRPSVSAVRIEGR